MEPCLPTVLHCRWFRNYTSHFITFYARCLQTYTAKSPIRSRSCFSILMSQGWFTNTGFWTYCEIYDTNDKVCPIRTRHQVMSTSKVAIGWAITVVCFVHVVVTAMEVLNINKTAQL